MRYTTIVFVLLYMRYVRCSLALDSTKFKFNGGHTTNIHGGGKVENIEMWPWQVFVELNGGGNQCGGTVISNRWVLTAAHCFNDGREPSRLIMGTTKKSGGKNAFITETEHRCCHKGYNHLTLDNDICLLQTKILIPFQKIIPATLPAINAEVAGGTMCTVTGWGYDENQNLPEDLLEADVKIIERQQCIEWHSLQGLVVVNNTICAGHEIGLKDTCGGDSGGPLICDNILRGITSYGPTVCGAAKSPGIYTDVSKFRQWIDETMTNPCPKYHFGPWSGICSVTCGRGTKVLTRKCLDADEKEKNPSDCNGSFKSLQFCALDNCPVYKWDPWKFGSCDTTCGIGKRKDDRNCVNENGVTVASQNCQGSSQRAEDCQLKNCPVYRWSSWKTECSVTCGNGIQTKTRDCRDEDNIKASPENCESGKEMELGICNLLPCKVYAWGTWKSRCSVTCGNGIDTRTRDCVDENMKKVPNEKCGSGAAEDSGPCSLEPCQVFSWGKWKTRCSVTCGQGVQTRNRHCLNIEGEKVEILKCKPGRDVAVGICKKSKCKPDLLSPEYLWGPWSAICDVTCGPGVLTKTRQCRKTNGDLSSAMNCGPDNTPELESCAKEPCPSNYYEWGEWSSWSECQFRSDQPCNGVQYATRSCMKSGKRVAAKYCSVTLDDRRQTTCSGPGCQNPSHSFDFEAWRRGMLGGFAIP